MNIFKRHKKICRCDHFAPSISEIRSVEFNRDQAKRLDALGMSSAAISDIIWTELTQHRTGKLFNAEGTRIGPDIDGPAGIRRYDSAVDDERRHFVKRYRARAVERKFRNRLQDSLVDGI